MQRPVFTMFVFFLCASVLHAQDEPREKFRQLSIHAVYVHPGLYIQHSLWGVVNDFRMLAPSSLLLKRDLSGYSQRRGYEVATSPFFSAMAGIKFSNRQKSLVRANPILRIGLSYFSEMDFTTDLYRKETVRFDTLVSSQVGQTEYLDSVTTSFYNMKYSSAQVRIDASIIFATDPYARFSLFTGAGFTAGISIHEHTEISYYSTTNIETVTGSTGYISTQLPQLSKYSKEEFENKSNLGLSVFIPIGVDLRLGQVNKFWRRAHVYFEMRPGANFVFVPEIRTIKNAGVQNTIGFRLTLD